jgi:glycerophosphoryl diester phosphodiesterase
MENTSAAMEKAVACGADMVEFDLRRTADGVIILFHDPHILTPSGSRKKISATTFAEVSEIARHHGYAVATFGDILRKFGNLIAMDIEIKEGGFESEVVGLLEKIPPKYEPIISSFKPRILNCIKSIDSPLRTGLVIGPYRIDRLVLLTKPFLTGILFESKYESIHLNRSLATRAICRKLSNTGIPLYIWTVNDPDEMRRYIDYGASGIISDMPDVVFDLRERLRTEEIVVSKKTGDPDQSRGLVEER